MKKQDKDIQHWKAIAGHALSASRRWERIATDWKAHAEALEKELGEAIRMLKILSKTGRKRDERQGNH